MESTIPPRCSGQHSFSGLDPSDTDNTDGAVAWEFTPDSTQCTPSQSTSNAQAISGNIDTSAQSMDGSFSNGDLITDLLESDLGFVVPINGEEPNNVYLVSRNLGFDSINMAGQQMYPGQGLEAWDLHGTQPPRVHSCSGATIHINGSTDQSRVGDRRITGIAPMYWQEEEQSYNGDQGEESMQAIPRYVPGSRTEPWSTYEIADNQIRGQPSSDASLFALEADYNESTWSAFGSSFHQAATDQNTHTMSQLTDLPTASIDQSEDSDETIDRPPPENPVGPPPQLHSRGSRQRSLNPAQRANAALMRLIGVCWNCALLKYPCDAGVTCDKCGRKRRTSAIWECDRTYLPDLTCIFIPSSLTSQHEPDKLRAFCKARVLRWTDNRLTVDMTWGYGKPIRCEVHEIEPRGDDLLFQNQYRLNLTTSRYELHKVPSPPLGMMLLDVRSWRQLLDRYLDDFLQTDFEGFAERCLRGRECEVQRYLLHPMHAYHLESKDILLPRVCLKLIVITHIMTHSLTLTEDTRADVYSRLRNPPDIPYEPGTSPRWLNKELKFLMSTLHTDLKNHMLELLHKNLRDCKEKRLLWVIAFIGLLTLSMVTESMQVCVRCKEETDKQMGALAKDDSTAKSEVNRMDERLDFLMRIFWKKYHVAEHKGGKAKAEFNPVRDLKDRGSLDGPAQIFAREVDRVIRDYHPFLESRRNLSGPPLTPNEPRTSRLVAKFLLSF